MTTDPPKKEEITLSGPPPKDPANRRRRNATPGFRQLPNEGRQGPPPAFPLSAPTASELEMWSRMWVLPQAVEWERIQCEDMIALYVRAFIAATDPLLDSSKQQKLLAEVRQLDSKIGISPAAMQSLRWEIAEPERNGESDGEPSEEAEEDAPFIPRS